MGILEVAYLLIIAYLMGSVPTAVWLGKAFYKIDVREFGSGNAGATNTFRVLGKKAGVPVLLIDIFKGYLAVLLSNLAVYAYSGPEMVSLKICLGTAAVFGHIFPILAGFRGGKGVATLVGVALCISPLACSLVLLVFLAVLLTTRYVSLSSIIGGISFPFILNLGLHNTNLGLIIFSTLVAVLLVITHKHNIVRLFKRQESRISLSAKIIR